jgi:dihydrofolate reductase
MSNWRSQFVEKVTGEHVAAENRKEPLTMGTIKAHEFMSLDGVIDTPTWTFDYGFDPAMGQDIGNLMSSCEAILLGRNTYEMFEPAWSTRTAEEDPGAPFMNDSTKYVVSSTLKAATWNNSVILGPYNPETVRQLKGGVDGGIYLSGSGTLVRSLIADGLIDELHLFIYPLTRGSGPHLFPDDAPTKWSLARSVTYDNGVLYLVVTPATTT